MLILTTRAAESVYAFLPDGSEIIVTVSSIRGGKVRLRLTAPNSVTFAREAVADSMRKTHRYRNDLCDTTPGNSPPPSTRRD